MDKQNELNNKQENKEDFFKRLQDNVIDKEQSLKHYNEIITKEEN